MGPEDEKARLEFLSINGMVLGDGRRLVAGGVPRARLPPHTPSEPHPLGPYSQGNRPDATLPKATPADLKKCV